VKSRALGAEGLCLPLFAAAWFGATATGVGGPHHFQKWMEGEVLKVDTNKHLLAIRQGSSNAKTALTWDNQTTLFTETNQSSKPASHPGVTEADHLRAGEHVRVLYQNQGKDLIARRIVRRPAPEHVDRK